LMHLTTKWNLDLHSLQHPKMRSQALGQLLFFRRHARLVERVGRKNVG
jgi:hypothetical protein